MAITLTQGLAFSVPVSESDADGADIPLTLSAATLTNAGVVYPVTAVGQNLTGTAPADFPTGTATLAWTQDDGTGPTAQAVAVTVLDAGNALTYYDFGDGLPTSSLLLTQAPWAPGDFVFVAISAAEDGDGNAITGSGLLALTPAFVFRDDGGAATDPIPGEVVEIGGTYYARCQPDTVQPPGARWPAACVTVEVGGVRVGALEVWG